MIRPIKGAEKVNEVISVGNVIIGVVRHGAVIAVVFARF